MTLWVTSPAAIQAPEPPGISSFWPAIIRLPRKPLAARNRDTLTPVAEASDAPKRSRGILGAMRGRIWFAPDWDSPEVNAEIERSFYESEIFPDQRGVAED